MGRIQNFFSRLFKGNNSSKKGGRFAYASFMPFGTDESANAEANATYVSCINRYSQVLSKIEPSVVKNDKTVTNMPHLNYLLSMRPNPLQNANNFWKQVAVSYFKKNIALIYIDRDLREVDPDRQVKGLYLIDPTATTFGMGVDDRGSERILTFSFMIGDRRITCLSSDVAIITFQTEVDNPFVSHSTGLRNTLRLIDGNFNGLLATILKANVIQFIATSSRQLDDETWKEHQDRMNELFKSANGGILFVDGTQDLKQVQNGAGWTGTAAVEPFIKDIFEYFGIDETIVRGCPTADVYNSWIETSIEPITMELGKELSLKLLPQSAIDRGARVVFDTNDLYTASRQNMIEAGKLLISSGSYYPNEVRRCGGLPLLPDSENKKIERIDRVDKDKGSEDKNKDKEESGDASK